tara:strand:+ start:355 stop:1065 length:711 start_codon:yes stop_codon:yes gene_type:complete
MNIAKINPYKFLFSSGIIYYINNKLINKLLINNDKFKIYNLDRQQYISTNINKSMFLLLISTYFFYNIYIGRLNIFNLKITDTDLILYKNITSFYSITDFMSTILCFKTMKKGTLFHHLCVIFVNLWIINSEQINDVQKGIIMYGGFSSFAYLVNFFLGYRFLTKNYHMLQELALNSYVFSCLGNWTWQLFNILFIYKKNNKNYLGVSLYLMALYFWIKDDLILMNFLFKKNNLKK